ncbi:MAG: Zn-dependent alcohol dehydrogenase [Armatimonadetes bacterium]|nr:Zn-dependent alcohol dehydrogenase [Armatimonadota bacterium]
MKVRAAILDEVGGPIRVRTVDLAAPHAGEVLVKVAACGVCHSDWHLVTGETKHPLPAGIGHEGAGTIVELGPGVSTLSVGDSVALSWAPFCGSCFYCSVGQPNLCETYVEPIWAGTMLDGTTRFSEEGRPIYHYCGLACFAEYVVVPAMCCVPMPEGFPLEIAAVIGCAVTTGVGSVVNTAQVQLGSSVAVFGAGGVGLSTVMGAAASGATTIIAIDRYESRLEAARDLGATHTVLAGEDAVGQIRGLTAGRGADYVFEAIGSPSVQELCLEAARPGGTIVFSGLSPMGSSTDLPGSVIVRQEKTIRGSYYGSANPPADFARFAEWYREGRLPLDRLVSRRYGLDEIQTAFEDMLAGRIRRGVVVF